MLQIKQFFNEPSTVQNRSNLAEKLMESEIQIKFSNDEIATYNRDRLSGLEFFSQNPSPESIQSMFCNFNMRNFNAIVGVILDNKQLSDVFTLEDYSNVFLYEDLMEGIKLLHSSSSEAIIENLKKNYFPYLTLNQAQKLTESYCNMMKESDVVPLAVSIAENYLLMTNAFSNEEEACIHFDTILYYQMEINVSQIIIEKLNEYSQEDTFKAQLSSLKASKLVEWVESCERKLNPLLKMMDPNTMSMMGRQNFLRLLESEDPAKQAIAVKAQEELTAYKNTIIKILERNNSDMSRDDLLSFLIGPDAFLLDEYSVCYLQRFSNSDEWCILWTHSTLNDQSIYSTKVGYSLQDTGPYALEDDIRNDWLNSIPPDLSSTDIPNRIVKEKKITKKISDNVKDFQSKSIPILQNWNNCSDEELMIVKNGILSFNDLDDLLIHSNLRITAPSNSNFQTIKGFINCESYSRPCEINIDDFLLKIDNYESNSSRSIIEKMKRGQYIPRKKTSNFIQRG